MTDTITVRGFIATKPSLRQTPNNIHVTNFRLASTSRRYDIEKGEWVDAGTTNWYTVSCFRYLADNVAASLNVGDPILVQGRLKIREWSDDAGKKRLAVEIEASALGPDLAMGSAKYSRVGARGDRNQGDATGGTGDGSGGLTGQGGQEQDEPGLNGQQRDGQDNHDGEDLDPNQNPPHDPATGEILEVPTPGSTDRMSSAPEESTMTGGVGLRPGESPDLSQESEVEFPVPDTGSRLGVFSASTR